MTIVSIHQQPRDLPEAKYLVRTWRCFEWGFYPERIGTVANTLEEARAQVPEGFTRDGRHEGDERSVVESWA